MAIFSVSFFFQYSHLVVERKTAMPRMEGIGGAAPVLLCSLLLVLWLS